MKHMSNMTLKTTWDIYSSYKQNIILLFILTYLLYVFLKMDSLCAFIF